MLVSLSILITMKYTIHYWKWFDEHFPTQVQSICLAVHKILANKDFKVTDGLISCLFVVTFVHPTYM